MTQAAAIISEQRRTPRHELASPLTMYCKDRITEFGQVVNLSTDGMLIKLSTSVADERTLSLWLEQPQIDIDSGEDIFIQIQCVSKWSWQCTETQQHYIGCCFVDVDAEIMAKVIATARQAQTQKRTPPKSTLKVIN